MTKNKKNLILIVALACFCQIVGAQTNSPYSRYGYGVLKDQATGPSKGMGGIGYGLKNSLSANPINPASYSAVDTLTMLVDVGINYNFGKMTDNSGSRTDHGGGLDYVTVLFPVTRTVGISGGLLPFSSVGYDYGADDTVEDVEFRKSFSGSGGLSLAYLGLGYLTPFKGLSVGVNAAYIFGTIENQRSIPSIDISGSNISSDYSKFKSKGLKLDFGFQYQKNISPIDVLTVGAVYSPKMNLHSNYQNRHYDLSSTGTLIKGDTTEIGGLMGAIPHTLGAGFTVKRDKRITYGADVTFQKWTNMKYSTTMGDEMSVSDRFNNRIKVNVGGEYIRNLYDRNLLGRMKWRGGLNFSNSYMNIKDASGKVSGYNEYGAAVGFGIPFYDPQSYGKRTSYVNINFEYKKLKPKASGLINEDYFGVSFNMNINDFWFMKRKI